MILRLLVTLTILLPSVCYADWCSGPRRFTRRARARVCTTQTCRTTCCRTSHANSNHCLNGGVTSSVVSYVSATPTVIPTETIVAATTEVPATVVSSTIVPAASFSQTSASTWTSNNALAVVNQNRMRRGLRPFSFDPVLTATAQQKSSYRANRRFTGHDGLNRSGARAEGVGYASGGNLASRFTTCHMYSTSYTSAGAAIAYDGQGRAYYTLLLR